jgi:pre-mRNA-splicing factor SYF1
VLVPLPLRTQESLGTLETTKSAYNRAIDLKVATPQMVINFATYLEDKGFFEDSFKVCCVVARCAVHHRCCCCSALCPHCPLATVIVTERAVPLLLIMMYPPWMAVQAYERGVALFPFPHVKDIWLAYLTKFVERYKNRKLERARELYEQAVEKVPAADAMTFYLMYAKLEEDHGLTRHAMRCDTRAAAVAQGRVVWRLC